MPKANEQGSGSGGTGTSGGSLLAGIEFDAIDFTYNPDNTIDTILYYQGGLGGTLVATLTFSYTAGGQVDDIVRT